MGLRAFVSFCLAYRVSVETLAANADYMSDALIAFVQHTFDVQGPFWVALHGVLGVQNRWRHLRGKLKPVWDSLMSWKMVRTARSRVPARLEVVQGICFAAAVFAFSTVSSKARVWWNFIVAVRLAFFGLLRPKELFGLRRSEVVLPGPGTFRNLDLVVLKIASPKNKLHVGRVQVRLIKDSATVQWAIWFLMNRPKSEPVWSYSAGLFRSCLVRALRFCHLDGIGISASSFRAGGATRLLEAGQPVSAIRFAGGWASERSLTSYLQEAEAAASLLELDPVEALRFDKLLVAFAFCEWPPNYAPPDGRQATPPPGTRTACHGDPGEWSGEVEEVDSSGSSGDQEEPRPQRPNDSGEEMGEVSRGFARARSRLRCRRAGQPRRASRNRSVPRPCNAPARAGGDGEDGETSDFGSAIENNSD